MGSGLCPFSYILCRPTGQRTRTPLASDGMANLLIRRPIVLYFVFRPLCVGALTAAKITLAQPAGTCHPLKRVVRQTVIVERRTVGETPGPAYSERHRPLGGGHTILPRSGCPGPVGRQDHTVPGVEGVEGAALEVVRFDPDARQCSSPPAPPYWGLGACSFPSSTCCQCRRGVVALGSTAV